MQIISLRKAKVISLLLVTGVLVCTIHTVVFHFNPEIRDIYMNLWLSDNYREVLSVEYYLYEIEQLVCISIWFFAFGWAIRSVSKEIANVCFLFLLYFLTQIGFYVWNRNTSEISNYIVYIYLALAIIYIFIPKKQNAKIIQL